MYRIRMSKTDSKKVLWENVSQLMRMEFGRENLTQLAAKVGIGPGTSTRLKAQETSVGTDILDQIAHAFKVEPWQLLVPGIDMASPQQESRGDGIPMPMVSRERYESLPPDAQIFIQGYVTRLIEEQEHVQYKANGSTGH